MYKKQKRTNILVDFLNELNVPYTKRFSDKLYNGHPHQYDMYGLKLMCSIYNIKTIGVSIPLKDFTKLSYPCILHTQDSFIIGLVCDNETITYLKDGEK